MTTKPFGGIPTLGETSTELDDTSSVGSNPKPAVAFPNPDAPAFKSLVDGQSNSESTVSDKADRSGGRRASKRGGKRASKRGGSRASKRGGKRASKRGGKRSSRRGGSRASRR
jgi:hypothetical protein